MRNFLLLALIHLTVCGFVFAQSPQDLLNRAREIKLLESDRHDVRRLLYDLNPTDDDGHFQRFSNDRFDIEITYASGTCSEDSDEEEDSEVWKIEEWKVVKIEIRLDESVAPKDLGFDLSKLTKEQEFVDSESFIYHDKIRGMAFETSEDDIDTIIFFPPDKRFKQLLCENNSFFNAFYSRKSWFSEALENRKSYGGGHPAANVTGLSLDKIVIEATANKVVRIETVANDPENDPLVYKYAVSAGRIQGTGAKVAWDLTGVPAGTYTITAGVDDGCGICGQTQTKTVTVK